MGIIMICISSRIVRIVRMCFVQHQENQNEKVATGIATDYQVDTLAPRLARSKLALVGLGPGPRLACLA